MTYCISINDFKTYNHSFVPKIDWNVGERDGTGKGDKSQRHYKRQKYIYRF
jgi:hypothetical protein